MDALEALEALDALDTLLNSQYTVRFLTDVQSLHHLLCSTQNKAYNYQEEHGPLFELQCKFCCGGGKLTSDRGNDNLFADVDREYTTSGPRSFVLGEIRKG